MEIKKIGVLTSGGDAPGMNAAIRAVMRSATIHGIETYGIYKGYYGMYYDKIKKLTRKSVGNILDQGGTFLQSARFPEFKDEKVRKVAMENLKKHGIDALVAIGGDGTYMGALRLSELGLAVVGIPGTIDNDVSSTDYTIGFDTTLNTIVECLDKLRDTSYSHNRAMVVEVMGRHNPDLAVRAGIACGAECVISTAEEYSDKMILDVVHQAHKLGKQNCLIVVCEHTINVDYIKDVLNKDGTYETRSCILGQIQRGGNPSAFDRVLAGKLGAYAVKLLVEGKTGICVGIKNDDCCYTTIEDSCNTKKPLPDKLIELSKELI